MIKNEQIPIEVVVKYNESGECRPLKILFRDELFVIDKVYYTKPEAPPGQVYAMQMFSILISGKRRKIYFEKNAGKWYVFKEIAVDNNKFLFGGDY